MSELITRQAQGKAARAHAAQIAQLERERDAAIRVCEMAQTSGAFNVRWAETMQKRAEAAEGQVAELEAEKASLWEDAARFRALMRCGRIKPQGSAGVHPGTGERTYPDEPGSVHFGAEFWVQPEATPSNATIWGRFCLRALADDILAYEAAEAGRLAIKDA